MGSSTTVKGLHLTYLSLMQELSTRRT